MEHPTAGAMTATDAQAYWMSGTIPSDQFLLYCFDHGPDAASLDEIGRDLMRRAAMVADLSIRVAEVPLSLDFPYWVPAVVSTRQLRRHHADGWDDCLVVLGEQMADQIDLTDHGWRLHLFSPIADAPGIEGPAVVAVLQIAHALADGGLASDIARRLLGSEPLAALPDPDAFWPAAAVARAVVSAPVRVGRLTLAAVGAHRAHRQRERDIAAGRVSAAPAGGSLLAVNTRPDHRRELRTVHTDRDTLRAIGGSVTLGALVVISEALAEHLEVEPSVGLRAEITVAKPGVRTARNHFRNAGIGLWITEPDRAVRARHIADEVAAAVARAAHPATVAEAAAMASVPAALIRWGVSGFDADVVPDTMTGNVVVSSVDRGAADLVLGGGRVVFTAGFPALSPMQTLTHGVHGIGDRVVISICSSPTGLTDVDAYRARLAARLIT
ncbi:wax ester/triacylglycerol synthase domain-containing protein [Williamsia sp. MIQD14]|uniref:wax ester/triacylglycerol synthase domain-containing protein n=1 Tax=Williamsia sp. MIQD14 TaxID=3425703 RepID=UPI003DA1074F